VVDGRNAGIGGGCFILIRTADGELAAIDGRETAPAAATRDMYLRAGEPQRELSLTGPLASGVPGALAAYDRAVRRHGKRRLGDLLLPAAEIAERGFPIQKAYAAAIEHSADKIARFEGTRNVLLRPDGSPHTAGEVLRQPDLARTYRAIAEEGIGWFYRGPLAERVGRWMADHGGLIAADDFAAYRARDREPVVTRYRQYTIVGFPPPSSGGVHVAQILHMLERFDLKALYRREPAAFYHVAGEAMKRAFADRAHWLGDPDFADVPRGLVDPAYAARLAEGIALERATPVATHGRPPGWERDHFGGGKHTTHIAAADDEGNWVAITATVNTGFGSKVIVPGTGVILNNEMDDFSAAPGVPNTFGLVGAEANAIAPGKRPLSSMSPTIVLRDGRPILTLGAAGGPKIITQVVMAILYHLDLGLTLPEAVRAPRIHHQWRPDRLLVERSLEPAIVASLEELGHEVRRSRSVGVTQAIALTPAGRVGVHDPRVEGKAAGL
jgi:gamma-glutamyltranspeptidase/glutathione hydrolase